MDLIDRKELVKWLKDVGDYLKSLENTKLDRKLVGKIIDHVEAMSTVEAEPVRHGNWITKDVGFLQKSLICSACGGWEHNLAYKHEGMNYCPNCGAKMED